MFGFGKVNTRAADPTREFEIAIDNAVTIATLGGVPAHVMESIFENRANVMRMRDLHKQQSRK
jgi:hypothetical protein